MGAGNGHGNFEYVDYQYAAECSSEGGDRVLALPHFADPAVTLLE